MKRPLNAILDGVSIPFAYKLGYMINSYREPSFRAIEATHGLTRPEILSLIFLYFRDGIWGADMWDFSGHLKNNISRAITALEGKGLVRREPDPQDQRRLILYITPAPPPPPPQIHPPRPRPAGPTPAHPLHRGGRPAPARQVHAGAPAARTGHDGLPVRDRAENL